MKKELTKDDLYFCYSVKLSRYLQEKGFKYLFAAKEIKTDNIFSLYYKSPELKKALQEYKNRKI